MSQQDTHLRRAVFRRLLQVVGRQAGPRRKGLAHHVEAHTSAETESISVATWMNRIFCIPRTFSSSQSA